jgi:hypothetical protein
MWYFKTRKMGKPKCTANNKRIVIQPLLFFFSLPPDDDDDNYPAAAPISNEAPIARSTSSGVILIPITSISGSASGSVITIAGTTNSPGYTPSSLSPSASASRSISPASLPSLPGLSALASNDADCCRCCRRRLCLEAANNGSRLPMKNQVRLPRRPLRAIAFAFTFVVFFCSS